MIKIYNERRKDRILLKYEAWIGLVCRRYGVPPAAVKAVLSKEILEIDLLDPVADLLVHMNWCRYRIRRALHKRGLVKSAAPWTGKGPVRRVFGKFDSSTGYAQIFAGTAIDAANFALNHGLDTAASLRLPEGRRLDRGNYGDLCVMWHRLLADRKYNIRMGVLNLLAAAEEMNGHRAFDRFTDEEMARAFTRYNANVRHVTDYGREALAYYRRY